jgi:hypothetical protein
MLCTYLFNILPHSIWRGLRWWDCDYLHVTKNRDCCHRDSATTEVSRSSPIDACVTCSTFRFHFFFQYVNTLIVLNFQPSCLVCMLYYHSGISYYLYCTCDDIKSAVSAVLDLCRRVYNIITRLVGIVHIGST